MPLNKLVWGSAVKPLITGSGQTHADIIRRQLPDRAVSQQTVNNWKNSQQAPRSKFEAKLYFQALGGRWTKELSDALDKPAPGLIFVVTEDGKIVATDGRTLTGGQLEEIETLARKQQRAVSGQ